MAKPRVGNHLARLISSEQKKLKALNRRLDDCRERLDLVGVSKTKASIVLVEAEIEDLYLELEDYFGHRVERT